MSNDSDKLRADFVEANRTIAELRTQISDGENDQQKNARDLEESRSAMLFMLEDLENARMQIEQAHHQWMAALDAVKDPIFLHDKEFRILRANRAYQQCAGMEFSEMIGRRYFEVFPKLDGPMPGCLRALEAGKLSVEEVVVGDTIYFGRAIPVYSEDGEYVLSVHTLEDVTARKQQELALRRANRALMSISAGNEAMIHAVDEGELLLQMCEIAVNIGGYHTAWIGYARDDANKTIEQIALAGSGPGCPDQSPLTWDESRAGSCPAARAIIGGEPRVVQDIRAETQNAAWRERALASGYASCIALPLNDGSRAFGALVLFDDKANVFDAEEVRLLKEMADDLAFGILTLRDRVAHRAHEQRLQTNMLQTVKAIASIVEMRDPYTSGHQSRVADVARAIARQMGLSDEQQQAIHLAGLVHDLGKIRIPAEILSKPGRLNDVEYSLIKMHPQSGYDILKDIDFSWPIAEMVLQHHERLDGSGYPQGLKGEAILLGARILCVADVVEAMSSHRPYRPGLGLEAALEEVKRGRDSFYDAQVADACLALFKEENYVIPK